MSNLHSKKTFIIAEIGNNHEGSFDLAKKLIIEAAKCGVDAVKFQTFNTEDYVSKLDIKRSKRLKKFELNKNEFIKISKIAKHYKLKFISTPFDIRSAIFLNNIVDYFKISSGDNNYTQLIDKVLSFNKSLLISTGLLSLSDIMKLKSKIFRKYNYKKIWFLHCVSSYPTDPTDANLKFIQIMTNKISKNIGYSDHTIGFTAPIIAISYGAKVIEKHFTLDNNFSNFRDHKLSLNPKDMKNMVNHIRVAENMIKNKKNKISRNEKKNLKLMRRGVYLKVNKKKGDKIIETDLSYVRPNIKLNPGDIKKIIGKKIKKNIRANYPLLKSHIEQK